MPASRSCWSLFRALLRATIVAIGLDSGPLSQWLHREKTTFGFEAVLMETRQMKGILKAIPIKTDLRDVECPQGHPAEHDHARNTTAGTVAELGLKVCTISRSKFEHRIHEFTDGNAMLQAARVPMWQARSFLRQELAGRERLVRQMVARIRSVCA
ncbi:hypothetical protein [Paracoccus sp. PAR01]|uniref:hypothetical protein n=1 Tax=Paracoccus sp. PAR01 TaxID=2769282 RepID=UPI001786E547|nr:hypothetical protein [Paracoccus sp. PAR01]MBD9529532.1 hypothetical protein [Paracoccus sp. PAR01]